MNSSTTNHLVNNQRGGTSRGQFSGISHGRSSSLAQIYQTPSASTSAFQQHNQQNQRINPQSNTTSHPHLINSHQKNTHQKQPTPQLRNHHQQDINYSTRPISKDRDNSVSVSALHRLSQLHTKQQTNNHFLKQRTYSTSAISSVHTNFHNNQTNLLNHGNQIEDLSNLVAPKHQDQQTAPSGLQKDSCSNHHHQQQQQQISDQLDRDSEETTIKEEEFEDDLEALKTSELEALSSLEQKLPIEMSFLIRQQAFCMARLNYLHRQIRELQETSEMQQSQLHQHQQNLQQQQQQQFIESTTAQMNPSPASGLNQRLSNGPQHNHNHYSQLTNQPQYTMQQRIYNAQGQAVNATTNKNGNFILSDDSGGEYSRATISDDDELSSLLDQIVKSVRPDQQQRVMGSNNGNLISNNNVSQSMPASHQHQHQHHQISNQLHHQKQMMAAPNYGAFQGNHQQQYAIVNSNQLHSHHHHPHQQAVPIFVMSSPIVAPLAHHASSISSNILPGIHFQPEPRYNQYYEDYYCSGPNNINQGPVQMATNIPMMMPPIKQQPFVSNHHAQEQQQHHQQQLLQQQIHNGPSRSSQQFDSSITVIEQLVSQKEKRQIMSQLKSADNWLKMRSSMMTSNGGNTLNESSLNSGSNNNKSNNMETISSNGGGNNSVKVLDSPSSAEIVE